MKISPVFTESIINSTLDKTINEVSKWREMALKNDVPVSLIDEFEPNLRLNL
jgi:serine/threonine-protein kinase HipA